MSTKTSFRFLVIASAFLNGYAVSAQNSFSTAQTPVANNTLEAELSGANFLSTADSVKVEPPQTNYEKQSTLNLAEIPSRDLPSELNHDRSLTRQDLSTSIATLAKADRPQTNSPNSIFSTDLGTLRHNPQMIAMPFQAKSAASIEIPVPPPLTQIIPNALQVAPIQPGSPSAMGMPTARPEGFIVPRSNPTPFTSNTSNTSPTTNFTPFTDNGEKDPHPELIYPLMTPARITSRFGWRTHPLTGKRRFHSGLDIAAPTGAPVVATESGTIVSAGWNGGYGKAIVIQHNGTQQTLYGHLSEISVQSGQSIAKGTVIGLVGSTGNSSGPHLHFESRMSNGSSWVAVDPSQAIQYAVANLRRSMPFARKDLPQGL